MVTWKYNDYETNHYNLLVPKAKIGTVWGLAYDNRDKSVYAAAFLRKDTQDYLIRLDNDGYGKAYWKVRVVIQSLLPGKGTKVGKKLSLKTYPEKWTHKVWGNRLKQEWIGWIQTRLNRP